MATNKEILKALERIEESLPNGDLEICRNHLEELQLIRLLIIYGSNKKITVGNSQITVVDFIVWF